MCPEANWKGVGLLPKRLARCANEAKSFGGKPGGIGGTV
jgi:hypothetical protein